VERPFGSEMLFLQIYGIDATEREIEIINKILKHKKEGDAGDWREL